MKHGYIPVFVTSFPGSSLLPPKLKLVDDADVYNAVSFPKISVVNVILNLFDENTKNLQEI